VAGLVIRDESEVTLDECRVFDHGEVQIVALRRATLTLHGCIIHSGRDIGVSVADEAQVSLDGCEVFGHANAEMTVTRRGMLVLRDSSVHDGHGFGVMLNGASARIEGCDIAGHAAPAVSVEGGATPIIERCVIRDGQHSGIYVEKGGRGTIDRCQIYGHALANVIIRSGGDPTMLACTVYHDNARANVALTRSSNPTLRRCAIHDGGGIGVRIDAARGTLEDCTISGHQEAEIVADGSPGTVFRHCSIQGTRTPSILLRKRSHLIVEECTIADDESGAWQIETGSSVQRKAGKSRWPFR